MPNLIFMVHKNSTNQTNIPPAEAYPSGPVIDPQVTFTHAIRNDLNGSSVPVFDLAPWIHSLKSVYLYLLS